ncbi:uncharacterized protein [Parasteatoda tepidariorum]|uniref:uncharacterized protein isoform X2 n=1 Tax=Parasteatoda tepidariorum TaxID=114398 RepID=UPI001C727849|nr:uncharacterized protein LOC107452247 isoform X2 [Parasteatoda tepidariorum]
MLERIYSTMNLSWKKYIFITTVLAILIIEAYCRPSDETFSRSKRQAVEEKQFIGGLSTLGALVQPILFMIGMANMMGRIPMFFNRMRDRFSSTLSGTGAPAGAGRKKRSLENFDEVLEQKSNQALRMLDEAGHKYQEDS